MEKAQQILILARAIEESFSSSEWQEIGLLTSMHDYITRHARLLRSLFWHDDDYKGCVIEAVTRILDADPANFRRLLEYEPISGWLETNNQAALQALRAHLYGTAVPEIMPTASEAALSALADAQALLETRGPASAVDRVHTGFHGFLKSACIDAKVECDEDASANQLMKVLLAEHPKLQGLGPRDEEIRKLLRTSMSIVDAMGTLRNRASLAHPNEELLGHEEALLAIDLARSLLRFLDARLRPRLGQNEKPR